MTEKKKKKNLYQFRVALENPQGGVSGDILIAGNEYLTIKSAVRSHEQGGGGGKWGRSLVAVGEGPTR